MAGTGGVLVGTDHSGVDSDCPLGAFDLVGVAAQLIEQLFPSAIGRPAAMSVVDGLPMPVVRGNVAPGQPAAGSPEHPVDHRTVIGPAPTPLRFLTGQQRLQPGPFLVGQIMTIEHTDGLPHPLIKIRGTRSSPGIDIAGDANVLPSLLGVRDKGDPSFNIVTP